MEPTLIWTLSNIVNDTTRRVNAAPDGRHWISQRPYAPEDVQNFQRQYDGGDMWSGQIIIRCTYRRDRHGSLVPDEQSSEAYFTPQDFVVCEDGRLVGFLAEDHIVLWKADFAPGGRFYGTDGIILHHWGNTVEFGCLGYSRW